jgi:iron complex outermembrane recepter protein
MRRSRLTLCAGCVALCYGHFAPAADSPAADTDTALEVVNVTASRVRRDGYEAPTPTTVLNADDLTLRASDTLADLLAALPQMRNPTNEGTGGVNFAQSVGRGFVNLRGLGSNRTLVLLDGQRIVSNDLDGDRDLLSLPSALIDRVEVVTGGASALYGSDAVAGVVNFVLDTRFTGFKANIEGGTSQRSDASEGKASIAWGGDLGERWHLIASAEFFNQDGVNANARSFASPPAVVPNPGFTPTNGERPLMVVNNAYDANASTGGLILNGPLTGQAFSSNGTTAPYVPSSCSVSQPYLLCNSRQNLAQPIGPISLTTPQQRISGFERLTFQITPEIETHFDAMLAHVDSSLAAEGLSTTTFGFQIPINVANNPYLPAAVRSQYLAAGITTLSLGRDNLDEGTFEDELRESEANLTLGMSASLGASWILKAHTTYGEADTGERWLNAYSTDRFLNAVDAVSVNGTPTCHINAVTVTAPACAPANIFGSGNLSAAAKAYFTGNIDMPLKTQQREVGADLTGEPLSLWAGPVSFAVGATYRQERARQFNDGVNGDFAFTGFPPLEGEISTREIYSQAVLPLARDLPFARAIDVDLAARWVHYSQAGTAWPWKLGLNWVPLQGVRVRLSKSEDIRAPNIVELNLPQSQGPLATVVNPQGTGVPVFNALGIAPGQSLTVRELDGGNPALKPEVAHTSSAGLVLQPSRLQAFTASIDYFQIRIDSAITTLDAQTIVQACAAGNATQCQLISAAANSTIPNIAIISINAQSFLTRGLDSEVRYNFPLGGGEATLRALANYLFDYKQTVPGTAAQDLLGDLSSGLPRLQGDLSAKYQRGQTTAFVSADYIGSGDFSKSLANEIQNNTVPHVWYVGTTLNRQLQGLCGECSVYFSVNNLFDQEPPHPGYGQYTNIAPGSFFTGVPYDRVGRFFKLGFRLKLGGEPPH